MRIVLLSLFIASVSHAALPPSAESLRRFKAVTESKELFEALKGRQVSTINHAGEGLYTIGAEGCYIAVKVEAVQMDPPRMVPPLKTTLTQVSCPTGDHW